jgi:transcription elongation GreA/GreB family factor
MIEETTKVVTFDSTVVVKINNIEKTISFVKPENINTEQGKLSIESPIAKAIHGHKEGEIVGFTSPTGNAIYIIILEIIEKEKASNLSPTLDT